MEMFFGVKRLHLRILAGRRELLAGSGMTPARYDMLRVIDAQLDGMPQGNLAYLLGVCGQTVSRMLRSLEKLGFVVRTRMARDKRRIHVELTPLAAACLVEADMELFESGASEDMALRGFMQSDVIVAWKNLRAFRRCLCRLRRAHGDTTPFEEPWRGGELPYPPTFVHEAA